MGILHVLRGLGRCNLARLPILSIPNTDDIASVSPFLALIIPL